jgi:MoaA/NifB/PqqE/SkfB family radical SAM enzyme
MDKRMQPEISLDFVCFGITDTCNLRCKMCQKWKEDIFIQEKQNAPSLKDWKNCLSSLRSIARGPLQINFGGGEPLLKEGLFELIRFSKTKGFTANLATNGYLLDEKMAKKIADSGLDSVIISLDSLDESTHDYLRGVPGVYRQALAAIDHLEKYGKGIYKGICCVIYEKNLEGVLRLAEWVDSDPRLNSVYFMAAMQPNNTALDSQWRQNAEFSPLWPADSQKACLVIDKLIEYKNKGFKITNEIVQLEAFKLYYTHPERFVKNTKCNLDTALHISSCGDIFLCYRWGLLGNIKTDALAEVWYSQKAQKARLDIASCRDNCHFLLNCFFKGDYPFELCATETNK